MNEGWLSVSLQQIHIFLNVVKYNGFLSASRQLHMTQSAVSKSIARMEKQLQLPLFERNTRHIKLTEEGEQLYRQWKGQFKLMQDSYEELEKRKWQKENTLKVGLASTTRPSGYFQGIQERFAEKHPDIGLRVESEYMTELEERLNQGDYDLIFIPDFERFYLEEQQMEWKWAASSNAYVFVQRTHPLAQQRTLRMEQLLEEDFVMLQHPMTFGYERDLKERFLPYGVVPKFSSVFRNAYTLRLCFAPQGEVLFVDDYYDYMDNSSVVRIPVEDEYNGIICGWNPDSKKQSLKKFLDIL